MAFKVQSLFDAEAIDEVDFAPDEMGGDYWELDVPRTDRDYQNRAIVNLWKAWDSGYHAPLVVAPTSSGKTVIAGISIQEAVRNRGARVGFIVDRLLLLEQARLTFESMGLRCGTVVADEPTDFRAPVQLMSVQTIQARFKSRVGDYLVENSGLGHFDYLFFDECHRATNKTHMFLRRCFPGAKVCGLTATPIFPNGKMLGPPFYDHMILVAKPSELVANGYILDSENWAPNDIDLEGCDNKGKNSDYNKAELVKRLCRDNLVGSTISHWKEIALGKLTLVFCVNRRHASWLADKWNKANIPSAYMGCETPKEERKEIFKRFRAGEVMALHCSDLLTEGVDLPWVEAVQIVKPTKSLRLLLQMYGRGGRRHTFEDGRVKANFTMIDHAGCGEALCYPNTDIPWILGDLTPEQLLKAAKDRGEVPKTKICPKCFQSMPTGRPSCQNCGHVFREVVTPQEIENQPGKLVKVKETNKKLASDASPADVRAFLHKKQRGEWIRALRTAAKRDHTWGMAANMFKQATGLSPWEAPEVCKELPPRNDWKAKISLTPELVP